MKNGNFEIYEDPIIDSKTGLNQYICQLTTNVIYSSLITQVKMKPAYHVATQSIALVEEDTASQKGILCNFKVLNIKKWFSQYSWHIASIATFLRMIECTTICKDALIKYETRLETSLCIGNHFGGMMNLNYLIGTSKGMMNGQIREIQDGDLTTRLYLGLSQCGIHFVFIMNMMRNNITQEHYFCFVTILQAYPK
ncbi:hypothetical protein ACJX0J_021853 [Zea mays]